MREHAWTVVLVVASLALCCWAISLGEFVIAIALAVTAIVGAVARGKERGV